jgi:hypothetical protein
MGKPEECPACHQETDRAAAVCSNPACRRELALCWSCRAVTTFTLVVRAAGPLGRDRLRCDRCLRVGVRCVSWSTGGYCNGLASPTGWHLRCPRCAERIGDAGRSAATNSLAGALGGVIGRITRRRQRGQ